MYKRKRDEERRAGGRGKEATRALRVDFSKIHRETFVNGDPRVDNRVRAPIDRPIDTRPISIRASCVENRNANELFGKVSLLVFRRLYPTAPCFFFILSPSFYSAFVDRFSLRKQELIRSSRYYENFGIV